MQQPLVQKLPIGERDSFVARTYRTPNFEVGWHKHVEYELILFTEGSGMSFVGNHIGEFKTGDVYFLGSNLPHTFQKRNPELITSAVVVQFKQEVWGAHFLDLPEALPVRELFARSAYGLKANMAARRQLKPWIVALEQATGFRRLLLLGQCLELLATGSAAQPLSATVPQAASDKKMAVIDKIFQYTLDNFREPITLQQVATLACLSVPAFCSYFKKSTQKTYVDFLNEIRIGYAATLLLDTDKTIADICYESGYQTPANFHKQFYRIKQFSPLQYRKEFRSKLAIPQNNIGIVA